MGKMQMRKVSTKLKKMFLVVSSILLFVSSIFSQIGVSVAYAATSSSGWKSEYNKIINNWKLIEKCEDMSYYKHYFGADYKFDHYFLCDVDHNNTPELFLDSRTMHLTAVLTYSNKKIALLMCNAVDKINIKNSEIIIKGHWHGAGGSGTNEWYIFKVKNKSCKMEYYIDNLFGKYSVYNAVKCISTKKVTYNKILSKYVKSPDCIDYNEFERYNLGNEKGLDNYSSVKNGLDNKKSSKPEIAAYEKFLVNKENDVQDYYSYFTPKFAVVDINKDGVKELMYCDIGGFSIYTYKNKKIYEIYSGSDGDLYFNTSKGYIIYEASDAGTYYYSIYKIDNIKTKQIASIIYTTCDEQYNPLKECYYTMENKKISKEEADKYLTKKYDEGNSYENNADSRNKYLK